MSTNKAMIAPIPTDRYIITTSDVVNYLENEVLGFKIGSDFTRWTGVDIDHSYVRMRAVFDPKDITVETVANNFADRVMQETGACIQFKDTIIKSLTPFMFPKTSGNIRNDPDSISRLALIGLYGENLDDVIHNSGLTYSKDAKFFRVYLRPERIIAEMLQDPVTGVINGELFIRKVSGTTSETIRWEVEVVRQNSRMSGSDISIDSIFSK